MKSFLKMYGHVFLVTCMFGCCCYRAIKALSKYMRRPCACICEIIRRNCTSRRVNEVKATRANACLICFVRFACKNGRKKEWVNVLGAACKSQCMVASWISWVRRGRGKFLIYYPFVHVCVHTFINAFIRNDYIRVSLLHTFYPCLISQNR